MTEADPSATIGVSNMVVSMNELYVEEDLGLEERYLDILIDQLHTMAEQSLMEPEGSTPS